MASLFVLHGSFGTPAENWIPWLADRWREEHGFGSAITPNLPTPDGQSFDTWAGILDAYRSGGILTAESVIVAHSSSPIFVLKYAQERDAQFRGLVSVSGFNGFESGDATFDAINVGLFVEDSELEGAAAKFGTIAAFYGDDDPNLPQDVLASFASKVGADVTVVPNGGHLNASSGYAEFPAVHEAVARMAT